MRLALAAALALLLPACEKCDSCKDGTGPSAGTPAQTASAVPGAPPGATAAPGAEPEAERKPPEVKVAWRGAGDTLELSVWEMHCAGCEAEVEKALGGLEGVTSVKADFTTSTVTLKLADASKREALIAQVRASLKETDFRILGE